ncbi:MAG: endo-1,4-beta-xylanase [Prevotella sp.]|nr:endo-1,4-beta-xylanase [Prevotella sp.]
MRKTITLFLFQAFLLLPAAADERDINISGDNTDKSATSYSTAITIGANDVVNVRMARYCYFSSTITGTGVLNLYAGGERGYLGNSDKKWNDWSGYTGDVHMWPYKENAPSAGSYNVVLMHGGKAFSPENIDLSKVNRSMENNRVILHAGATLCTEANTAGSGFRIGHLETEVGSTLQGYMKNSRAAYYMLGLTNTDATLAGTIAPSGYRDDTALGIIKEGTGTYQITGNNNYLSGSLRVLEGRVLVMNDRAAAESGKLRGALGAKASATEAVAFVFGKGVLGGTGSIGGTVDNYGVIEPGADGIGLLTLKNYAASKDAHLFVHPASVLRMEVGSTTNYDQLAVDGQVQYSSQTEDFSSSDKMPVVQVVLADGADVKVGDEFRIMTAKGKSAGDWHFDVKAAKYTWEVVEREENGLLVFVLRLVSLDDMTGPDGPDNPDNPESTMGAFYDDGIDDTTDKKSLKYYANQNGKSIGTAISLYKNDLTDSSLPETEAVGFQFNMLVAENEMKPEAFGGQNGNFNFYTADKLVNFANRKKMVMRGHCLVWNQQSPTWISSDGGKTNDKNLTRQEALKIMKDHITNVMQHYKGKVREWDVVNECLDDNQAIVRTNPDGYTLRTNSVWQNAIGDDYVDSAFVYAHRADPDAILYLNDYGVEFQGQAKSAAFYNLAMRLKNADIPIHGVGLQCHFSIGAVDSTKLDNTIRRFEEAGLLCIITEFDLGIPDTSEKSLQEQARVYRVITDIMLNHDNCPSMVLWGLKDNNSWRETSNPLLFTAQLDKKPAYYAVRSALRHRYFVNTAVKNVEMNAEATDAATYDLMGRRVNDSTLHPGIYIRSGKKFVVK